LAGHASNSFGAVATATTTTTTIASFRDKELPIATVYDDVLPPATAEWLHELCSDWNEDTKAHNAESTTKDENNNILNPNPKDLVFEFPLKNPQQHTPLQRFLNDLIWQMVLKEEETDNDDQERLTTTASTSPRFYVEYWTRQQWHHILAHQDMDEGWERLLRKQRHECSERQTQNQNAEQSSSEDDNNCLETIKKQKFKHPFAGQVLYLKVGTKVRGPTVVFDAANGGDLAQSPNQNNNSTTMVSVPAVSRRLLRFPGDRLHAVPRPHDVYWTFDQSQNNLHTPDYVRSVLLFNLWDTLPEDKLLDCGDKIFRSDQTTCWNNDDKEQPPPASPEAKEGASETCNPRTNWKSIPVLHRKGVPDPPDEQQPQQATPSLFSLLWEWLAGGGNQLQHEVFQIPLLGDAYKRGMSGYVARMKSFSWYDDETSTRTTTTSGGGRMVHPARDNLGESILPTSTQVEADGRFVVKKSGSGEL